MYISQTVIDYLDQHDAEFDVLTHEHTMTSSTTARSAGIPKSALAKGVLMSTRDDLVLAVVPASRRVDRLAVAALLRDAPPDLLDESHLPFIFRDCELGAIPAAGPAFGLPTLVDDALLRSRDIYFEGGDHEHLVHMRGGEFARLLLGQPHGEISY